MEDWKSAFRAFGALEAVRELTADPHPAWVFSRDGRSIRWANPAAGRVFGAERFADMAGKAASHADPIARQLAAIAPGLGEGGAMARLRLAAGARAVPLLCQCRPVRVADGQRGILVVALNAPARGLPPSEYASEDAAAAFFCDGAGRAVPGSRSEGRDDDADRSDDQAGPAAASQAGVAPPPVHDDEPGRFSEALLADEETVSPRRDAAPGAAEYAGDWSAQPGPVPPFARKPVRFLWQTDAADRFLFVSPGLSQLVGRTSEVVGETWHNVAARLKLDPHGQIAAALARHDTWSGLTAWWPVENSDYRIPAELTALPVFGIDQSFQGFRGFGVLKPGDAVTPDEFREQHGAAGTGPQPPAAPSDPGLSAAGKAVRDATAGNVVALRTPQDEATDGTALSPHEKTAFGEIGATLSGTAASPAGGDLARDGRDDDPPAPAEPLADAQTQSANPPEADAARAAEPPAEEPAGDESAAEDAPPDEVTAGQKADAKPHTRGLAEAEARIRELTSILNTATDGVLVIDEDGRIESINAGGEALFGVEEADLVGRPLTDMLHEDSRQEAVDYLSGLKENGVASVLNEGREVNGRAGEGTIPLFMTMGRIGSGDKGRFCAVLRDLSHWKQAEAELIAARRAAETASSQKSDFLARVSHEIRTPLNAIIGFAEVMIEERFGPIGNERYREYLRDMRTSGEHVVSLVNDLLDISKIEAGKLDLEFEAVSLNALVRESITLMQPQANRAHVILRSSLSPDLPRVVADQRTLRQIVLNLLSNSVKFTGPGGQVIASTAVAEDGEAILKVRDTGEGMSDEELERALEPFRQLTTASFSDGTGLGLPLTKALVEANRADFSIRSARGEGTIVTIAFPSTRVLSE